MFTTQKKYHNEDFYEYIANPQAAEKETKMFSDLVGQTYDCMPVGINQTFMPTEKDSSTNLDKAQYNIRERFGYLSEEDDSNE